MEAQFEQLFKVEKKTKEGKVAKQKDQDDEFMQALEAFPEFMQDSDFVSAYVRDRIISRNKRKVDKEERDRARTALAKVQEAVKDKGELLGAWRSKDFQYELWQLPSGKYYREIYARPGLRLNNK